MTPTPSLSVNLTAAPSRPAILRTLLPTLLCILLLLAVLHTPAHATKWDNDMLKETVELSVSNRRIGEVLAVISEQTGAVFSYDPQLFDLSRKVSLQTKASIAEVLRRLLPPSVTFKATGVYIILYFPQKAVPAVIVEQAPQIIDKRDTSLLNLKKISPLSSGEIDYTCHSSVIFKNNEEMKKQNTLTLSGLFLAFLASITQLAAQPAPADMATVAGGDNVQPFQLTFVYPLGIYGNSTIQNTYGFSINVIGGHTGGIHGSEFAGVFNINEYNVRGAQFAGVFNQTKGMVRGAQFAGIYNMANQGLWGAQFAGIFNHAQTTRGAQFAGISNYSDAGKVAMQAAGLFNVSNEQATVQAAGIFNTAHDTAHVQIAGVFNNSNEANTQVAGVFNTAKKANTQLAGVVNAADSSTVQIAGAVNITKRGGFQLGVVNVRDTTDGYMLGVVNIAKKGGLLEVELAAGDFGFMPVALSFRSGREKLYSILTLGRNFNDNYWVYGFGLGTSFRFSRSVGLNLEAVHYTLTNHKFHAGKLNIVNQLRPVFHWEIAKHFKLFAGPTFNLYVGNNTAENPIDFHVPYSFDRIGEWNTTSTKFEAWVGFTAGMRF